MKDEKLEKNNVNEKNIGWFKLDSYPRFKLIINEKEAIL